MASVDADAGATSRSPDRPIKRAPVVYGKRSNRLPSPSLGMSIDEQQQSFEYDRVHHAHAVPTQSCPSSPSPSVHESDGERSRSPNAADHFQFSFRNRLKELDEEFDNHNAQSSRSGPSPFREAVYAPPSQVKDLQSVSMGTSILSSANTYSGDLSPASLPPSTASFHATSSPEHLYGSPPVRQRARRATNLVLSDSGGEEQSNSSSASPVRHPITTPHSRSSPTPPTSSENPMASRKAKGKPAARDVLPLVFDGELPSAAELPIKSKKGRQSEPLARPKTKAPTKKERREAAFESSRIAANRPVDVARTQERKYSLPAFFASLRPPTSGAELPSDPIEKFSSPAGESTRAPLLSSMFGAPTRILGISEHVGTSNRASSSKSIMAFPPPAGDSDDEMPSVTSIIQQSSGKQQKLRAMKQVALQHADSSIAFDANSEDDDLLVVKDDMHAVAREEAAQRRLDKVHGSPVKDMATLRRINHPSVRAAAVSPLEISERELHELAKPFFVRREKGSKSQLTKKQLDRMTLMQHTEVQRKSTKSREEEWVKRGGKLSRGIDDDDSKIPLSQKLGAYAEQGLKAAEAGGAVGDEPSADESDEDYNPNLRGSASPEPTDADEDHGDPSDNMEISQVPRPQLDEEEEEVVAPIRRNKFGQRNPRVVVGSDDEGERPAYRNLARVQRDSASSMESQTEDENDKENSAKLMYDRSEDKENKAVVRHEPSCSDTTLGPRLGPLHNIKDGVQEIPSLASVEDFDDTASSPRGDVRSPLKDISKDEDDLFLSALPANSSFTDSVLRNPTRPSVSTLSLRSPPVLRSERIGRMNRLSLDSENDENDPSGFKLVQPSFLERLQSQVSPEPSLALINPLPNGGLSQLFSAEERSLTKLADRAENDRLSLTLDVGLKPALEVSGTLRQKAEAIFEKEQEYVVAVAAKTDRPKDVLYVNDHGFLTQTRPEDSSPQVYRLTPSQASKFIGTQVHLTQTQPISARPPLRTLSFGVSQEVSPEPQPLRRLRRRSLSPLERRSLGQNNSLGGNLNVFDILGRVPKPPSKAHKEKPGNSEFVAFEAEESDEDDMFGFGGPKKEGEEEEDDNEQDKVVEGLVDDTAMDAGTEAVGLVLEKHREYVEEDDERLQKLHQDAIEGKFRMKRRDRGIAIEYDSEEDEDDNARRIRKRMYKKRKIEGDSLEALGQNEETRAFYNTYHQDLIDEDDEFGHLREDVMMPPDDEDAQATEPEERGTVSVDEVRQHLREVAQSNCEVKVLDPEDTSWIDQSMMTETDDAVHVKVVERRQAKSTARHTNTDRMDFDVERSKPLEENDQERKQLTHWLKSQGHRRQGTGRSGNSAAVTGHAKVRTGGGSLRSAQPSNAASASDTRRTKTPSLLSTVSNRRDKFSS